MIRLRKFLLKALPSQSESSCWHLDFPNADLVVVLGGNGCGKTLFVRMLQNLLSLKADNAPDWPSDYQMAYLELETNQQVLAVEIDFRTNARSARILPANGHKDSETSAMNASNDGGKVGILPSSVGADGMLLSQTFLVADGRLGIDFNETLLKNLTDAVLYPLQEARGKAQEMLHCTATQILERERVLVGIEEQFDHLKGALLQIEENKAKHYSLDEELRQNAGELRKLQQRRKRSLYRKSLTERLNVLASWLAEVAQERAVVERLREQHVSLLGRFEDSYVPFRGLPEDLGERLQKLIEMQEKHQSLSLEIQKFDDRRRQKESELASLRTKRKRLEEEQLTHAASSEKNRTQITDIQERLKNLHQAHLEYEGKRDLKLRLLSEALGDSSVRSSELLENGKRLHDLSKSCQKLAQQRESCEERWLALYERERMQVQSCELGFPGFDSLPVNASELLPGLYRACGELRDSERQITKMQHQLTHFRRHPRLTAAGGLAFLTALLGLGAGIVMADWALGLFLALMISGISLVIFGKRLAFPPRVDKRLKTELDMLRNQWKRALDLRDELEYKLKPLLNYPDLGSALKALHNFESQRAKLQTIRNELITCEAEAAALPSLKIPKAEIATLSSTLPEKLQSMPPEHLVRHLEACKQLEDELEQIQADLAPYKSPGEKFLEMARFSAEISELEAREANEHVFQEHYRREIVDLSRAEQELQSESQENAIGNLLRERAQLEVAFEEALNENAIHLGGRDLAALWEQWRQMVDLRTELRTVRGELSAHPTLDELGCHDQILRAEMTPLQAEVVGAATEPIPDSENLDEEIGRCESEIARLEQTRKELPLTLEEIGFNGETSLDSLTAELEQYRQELLSLRREREELEQGMTGIDAAIAERKNGLIGDILTAASALVRSLTEGRIQEILYEPEGRLSIIDAAQRTLPIERLSGGLYDLLMIALRLAMIERLENYGLPVVLDDPFGRLDSEHLTRMRELLIRFSQRNQVILLSRDPRFGAWGPTVLLGGGQQSMESNLDAAGLNAESGYGAV